jgi:ornithine cyclodeaminase/alanine dehydrogenase-like protein (mu-crystallin family)
VTGPLALTRDMLLELDAMDDCIEAVAAGYGQVARGEAQTVDRTIVQVGGRGRMAIMPGVLGGSGYAGVKVQCTFSDTATGAAMISGLVLLHDGNSGKILATLDSRTVTELRTAAASAVATHYLARPDATRLAILGSGAQARVHLQAMRHIRPIGMVGVWSPTQGNAEKFKSEMEAAHPVVVHLYATPEEACVDADVICATTRATTPVLMRSAVPAGAHVNSVGSYGPTSRELDGELVAAARLYVDALHAIEKESGDILLPISEGLIDWSHVAGELGDLVTGVSRGREAPNEITLFKSIGSGVADVAAAAALYRKAVRAWPSEVRAGNTRRNSPEITDQEP